MFETRTQWSRYALTQPEVVHPAQGGRFNTTEIHCTEFFPAVRWGAAPVLSASKAQCSELMQLEWCMPRRWCALEGLPVFPCIKS